MEIQQLHTVCYIYCMYFTACVKIHHEIHVKNIVLPIKLYEALTYSYLKKRGTWNENFPA
jgi:hypothetical protein